MGVSRETGAAVTPIIPQKRNANRHTARGMQALETSLAKDGWIGAITVAADGETFDGSARVEKTAENGMLDEAIIVDSDGTRPIVVRRTDIPTATDERAVRLGIAANRVASLNLEWEPDVLAQIADSGVDLGALFTADEWADVAMPSQGEAEEDAPVVIDETKPTRCQTGDVWRIGRHTVACVDSTDRANVERLIAGRKVDMVVADPPYGMNLDAKYGNSQVGADYAAKHGHRRIQKSRGYAPVAGDDKDFDPTFFFEMFEQATEQFWFGADYYRTFLSDGGSWLVWDKRAGLPDFDYSSSEFELCWCKLPHLREILRIRWFGAFGMEQEGGAKRAHPTQKPIAIYTHLFGYGSAADLIFDPFLGSGPSLKAAEPSGRTVIGCELSPHYIDHIIEWGEAHDLEVTRIDG